MLTSPTIPLNSFTIKKGKEGQIILYPNKSQDCFYLKQYKLNDQYKLSVCISDNHFPNVIIMMDYWMLYNQLFTN
ncbi:hypothetical protein BK769_13560 [Bacillus thuringiensis serovar kumamtoensis]|uniref:Uncharacterized protein n=1 Tax=Bacillus thuringiensis serovar kumamotoensis TaxID=132267 RepID=A0A9X6PR86_BACUK|nr:hypothetical protein BK769_13560 [Bacillus thuringiensis serovar kumamtoensis]